MFTYLSNIEIYIFYIFLPVKRNNLINLRNKLFNSDVSLVLGDFKEKE